MANSFAQLCRLTGRAVADFEMIKEGDRIAMSRWLVTADGIELVPRLSEEQAAESAANWLREPARPVAVTWVEEAASGSEIRGRDLPLWRVDFEGSEPVSLYLHPWTGELLARRTDRWRVFDFLWMLHIMDFDTRDDFNHPLLQIAAALGLIIALSGVVFWAMTTPLLRRRRARVPVFGDS